MEKITIKNGTTLIIKESLGGWEATTEENYKAFIGNRRAVMRFSNREFKNIEEVKQYLMEL